MDRTVLPGNPVGEAADGVVGAGDRASMADSQAGRVNKDSGREASRPRVAGRTAIMAGRAAPIGRSSAGNAWVR